MSEVCGDGPPPNRWEEPYDIVVKKVGRWRWRWEVWGPTIGFKRTRDSMQHPGRPDTASRMLPQGGAWSKGGALKSARHFVKWEREAEDKRSRKERQESETRMEVKA